jgi:exonuclease III
VNGINARLPNLLRWLESARPDIVCLQELKAPPKKFPLEAIRAAGYGAIWHGRKSRFCRQYTVVAVAGPGAGALAYAMQPVR